jgi:hypothetical protein
MFGDNLIHPLHGGNHCRKTGCGKCQKYSVVKLIGSYAFYKSPPGMGPYAALRTQANGNAQLY